jgi:hypothetical protein
VQLNVTPKITPDNRVIMRVTPEVSSVSPTQIMIGNNTNAVAFNVQNLATTVTVTDGETVAIGGMITKNITKTENKVPWLGDLPYIGAAFRYRSEQKAKTELIIILTPRIVRCRAEAERVLHDEAKKMDWVAGDVVKTQGPVGMEPIIHAAQTDGGVDGVMHSVGQPIPLGGAMPPQAPMAPTQTLPLPQPVPPQQSLPQPRPQGAQPPLQAVPTPVQQAPMPVQVQQGGSRAPAYQGQPMSQPLQSSPLAQPTLPAAQPAAPATSQATPPGNGPVYSTPLPCDQCQPGQTCPTNPVPSNPASSQAPVQLPPLPPLTTPSGIINLGPLSSIPTTAPQTAPVAPSPAAPAAQAAVPAVQQPTDPLALPPGVRVNYMGRQGQTR